MFLFSKFLSKNVKHILLFLVCFPGIALPMKQQNSPKRTTNSFSGAIQPYIPTNIQQKKDLPMQQFSFDPTLLPYITGENNNVRNGLEYAANRTKDLASNIYHGIWALPDAVRFFGSGSAVKSISDEIKYNFYSCDELDLIDCMKHEDDAFEEYQSLTSFWAKTKGGILFTLGLPLGGWSFLASDQATKNMALQHIKDSLYLLSLPPAHKESLKSAIKKCEKLFSEETKSETFEHETVFANDGLFLGFLFSKYAPQILSHSKRRRQLAKEANRLFEKGYLDQAKISLREAINLYKEEQIYGDILLSIVLLNQEKLTENKYNQTYTVTVSENNLPWLGFSSTVFESCTGYRINHYLHKKMVEIFSDSIKYQYKTVSNRGINDNYFVIALSPIILGCLGLAVKSNNDDEIQKTFALKHFCKALSDYQKEVDKLFGEHGSFFWNSLSESWDHFWGNYIDHDKQFVTRWSECLQKCGQNRRQLLRDKQNEAIMHLKKLILLCCTDEKSLQKTFQMLADAEQNDVEAIKKCAIRVVKIIFPHETKTTEGVGSQEQKTAQSLLSVSDSQKKIKDDLGEVIKQHIIPLLRDIIAGERTRANLLNNIEQDRKPLLCPVQTIFIGALRGANEAYDTHKKYKAEQKEQAKLNEQNVSDQDDVVIEEIKNPDNDIEPENDKQIDEKEQQELLLQLNEQNNDETIALKRAIITNNDSNNKSNISIENVVANDTTGQIQLIHLPFLDQAQEDLAFLPEYGEWFNTLCGYYATYAAMVFNKNAQANNNQLINSLNDRTAFEQSVLIPGRSAVNELRQNGDDDDSTWLLGEEIAAILPQNINREVIIEGAASLQATETEQVFAQKLQLIDDFKNKKRDHLIYILYSDINNHWYTVLFRWQQGSERLQMLVADSLNDNRANELQELGQLFNPHKKIVESKKIRPVLYRIKVRSAQKKRNNKKSKIMLIRGKLPQFVSEQLKRKTLKKQALKKKPESLGKCNVKNALKTKIKRKRISLKSKQNESLEQVKKRKKNNFM